MNKRVLLITSLSVIVFALAVTGYFYWQETSLTDGKIIPGVMISGIDVGNLSAGEAIELLKEKERILLSNNVKLQYSERYWSLPYSAIAKTNLREIVKEAVNLGRGKGFYANFKEIRSAKRGDFEYELKLIPERKKVFDRVTKIKGSFDTKPVDPKVTVTADNKIAISDPRPGVGLNIDKTTQVLLSAIKPNKSSSVEAQVYSIKPRFSAEDIKKWTTTGFISTFTTSFNALNKERTENVRIAAQAIDKLVIYPGEEFSFNKVVGPRSEEAGYKESLVIQNNIFTPGLGGGVCQVSSTLYNNLLKTNLSIVERRRHSLPVGYVSPGLDATVAYGFIDLKFKNNYDFPVVIRTNILSNKLFIGLLGNKSKIPLVNIDTKIDRVLIPSGTKTVYDPSLPKGKTIVEQPKKGYKVSVYKHIATSNGVKTIKVSTDTYPATPQIIKIGTGKKTVRGATYGQAL